MEIGFSNDQLIDIGLNAAGFIIAGLMMLMFRSLFARRPQATKPSAAENRVLNKEPKIKEKKAEAPDPQFVSLTQVQAMPPREAAPTGIAQDFKMRNRQEIIHLARKMLTGEGTTDETGTLPLTDGELSMIKQRLNLQGAGRSE